MIGACSNSHCLCFIVVSQILYESVQGERAPNFVSWISLALIMCGPVSNGFVYGIKSKTIQMTFVHFARKQMYKNEVGHKCFSLHPFSSHLVTASQLPCAVSYLKRCQTFESSL